MYWIVHHRRWYYKTFEDRETRNVSIVLLSSSSESNVRSFNLGGIVSRISLSENLWERPWSFEMSGFSARKSQLLHFNLLLFSKFWICVSASQCCNNWGTDVSDISFSWTVSLIPSMMTIFFSSVGSNLNDVSSWSNWTSLFKEGSLLKFVSHLLQKVCWPSWIELMCVYNLPLSFVWKEHWSHWCLKYNPLWTLLLWCFIVILP